MQCTASPIGLARLALARLARLGDADAGAFDGHRIQGILDDRLAGLGRRGAGHRLADRASEASASEASKGGLFGLA